MVSIGVRGSQSGSYEPFGGINVMLFSDLHQFPPVAQRRRESLFYPIHQTDSTDMRIGDL